MPLIVPFIAAGRDLKPGRRGCAARRGRRHRGRAPDLGGAGVLEWACLPFVKSVHLKSRVRAAPGVLVLKEGEGGRGRFMAAAGHNKLS